jgi:hypothetical protein
MTAGQERCPAEKLAKAAKQLAALIVADGGVVISGVEG